MTAGWISAADDARAREVRNLAVDHTDRADQDVVPPGSSATSRAKESRWNLGYLASGRQLFASAARTSWEMNGMCSQSIRVAGEPCKYMLWGDRSSAPASERAGGKPKAAGRGAYLLPLLDACFALSMAALLACHSVSKIASEKSIARLIPLEVCTSTILYCVGDSSVCRLMKAGENSQTYTEDRDSRAST